MLDGDRQTFTLATWRVAAQKSKKSIGTNGLHPDSKIDIIPVASRL